MAPASVADAAARKAEVVYPPAPPYADVADLVIKSPLIIKATVQSARRIKAQDAPGLDPAKARFLVSAKTEAVLTNSNGTTPPQIEYLIDLPLDAKGRAPKIGKRQVMLFTRPVPGRPNQVQLSDDHGELGWSPALADLAKQIALEMRNPAAPPVITGIGNAFHVPGSLPGEGETQIFLTTADGRPVSFTVLRRPGEATRWAVALSEIVDDAAAPPPRNTLLWYRLACFLPRDLPARSVAAESEDNAAAARDDYRFVMDNLGNCGRTLGITPASPSATAR